MKTLAIHPKGIISLRDPRYYQLLVLSCLLIYGAWQLHFPLSAAVFVLLTAVALLMQYAMSRFVGIAFDPRSAMISVLSLCLLARADSFGALLFAAAITILSKFALRWHGKHIFNPVNFALVILMLSGHGWVSPGQWGNAAFFGFLLACLGGLVLYKAMRSDVTLVFLLSYAALLFGRAWWLGDPWSIPLHQIQNGAFLLFSFFMISDPKTTPDSRVGRSIFALLVTLVASVIQFVFYQPSALIWALFIVAFTTPLLDRYFPAAAYHWRT
jgi:Na+-transporting NADH:ubiquinone oxidoreductase subunit NqrB